MKDLRLLSKSKLLSKKSNNSDGNTIDSDANFRNFFETIDDMLIVIDLNRNIIYGNKSLIHKLEYSLLELENMNILDIHPINKREEASKMVAELFNGDREYCPLEVESKSGKIYLVKTRIWFGKWDNKDCIFSISKDVSKEYENLELFFKMFKNNPLPMSITSIEDKYKKLINIIEGTNLGTWEWNIKTGEIEINEQWSKMIGYSLEELQPITKEVWSKFAHPEDLDNLNEIMTKHLNGEKEYYDCKIRMKHRDGRWIWIRDRGKVTERNNNGQPLKMFGTHSDITIEQEKSLELERFFSVNLDLLCIVDMEGIFIKTNKAWEDVLGYSSDELKGRKILEFIHEDDIQSTLETMGQLKKDEKVTSFINRYINKDGKSCYIEWRASPYEGMMYAAARDITERIKYEKKILEVSNRDALTGIYNRRYIYGRLEEIIEEYKRTDKLFSVCIIDIDFFKNINDTYGHQVGDYILKEFTKIVGKNLRPYDILGRYGGEEFIVILKGSSKKDGSLVLKRILNIVRKKMFTFDGQNIKITFSAGIVSCKEVEKDEISIDGLIDLADKRMYSSKRTGRNKIVFKTS